MSQATSFTVDQIIEKTVVDNNGKNLGRVFDIIIDYTTGSIEELILDAPTTGSSGNQKISIPFIKVESIADYVVVRLK